MIVFLNGEFVPEERAVISVFDRGFRYGDALFEAILAHNGKLFRAREHLIRLNRSASALRIHVPFSDDALLNAMQQLLLRNSASSGVIRLQLTRGIGPRGYAPTGTERSSTVISLHDTPGLASAAGPHYKLIVGSARIAADDALAHHKTCSRILNVLAATEARERHAHEALITDTDGFVTEACSGNVFWIENQTICTPPLSASVLPGITRQVVFELCDQWKPPCEERKIRPEALHSTDGVFLTFTSRGIVEAVELDGTALARSPLTMTLQNHFRELVERECAT